MKQILAFAALVIMITSCNTNYEKTKSGLAYKIFKGDGKQKLKPGQFVKINGLVKIAGRDTVLFTTYNRLPEYLPLDSSTRLSHDFNEVLKFASVGDSLVVISQVDTLVKRGQLQYNDMFKRRDQIVTNIKVLGAYNNQQEVMADQQKEFEKEKNRETAELEGLLKKKGINAQKTANGVFVELQSPGDAQKVTTGKQVTVNYRGSLFENGKVFDSNIDTSFGHAQPFSFVTGARQTIQGWEEGLQLFGKGGKGNLYIPALMGYGPQGAPPTIPPYAPLKFEVQVTNIAEAPAQTAPQMPGGAQGAAGAQGNPAGQQGQGGQGQPQGGGQPQGH
jgi:FKBP-type peptidyl-prolyl cis-trans isomerase FkpA